jgi:pilus assembly protein Flp/PilA
VLTALIRLLSNESAVTAIEYALIGGIIAIAAIAAMETIGGWLSSQFSAISSGL